MFFVVFFLFVCLFYFLERKTEKGKKKERKKIKLNRELIFCMETYLVQLFFPPD